MEQNRLILGNCFDVVKNIPDNSVDLIVTDPPYGINFTKGYKSGSTELIQGDDGFTVMFFLDDILREYKRILKPNSALYIFTRFDVMPYWWIKCKNYFDAKNCITWAKGGGFTGDLKGNYGNNSEMIIYLTNGKHELRGKREGNVWGFSKVKLEFHETQKPVDIIENIIQHSSDEEMTVFDPFMGSGTTGVACKNLNRNFIGIELNEDYYLTAKKRIENHSPQGGLFLNSFQTELSNEAGT
jgi:site-specific DNA-methyltransferase (adenine-specific)